MLAPHVGLNVGGIKFETTRDTLSQCEYFASYLEGRLPHATDADGRLFIDRNGKLFAHLLDFMRNAQRPSQHVVAQHKNELLGECDYFGLPWLKDLRHVDRKLYQEEAECALLDVFKTDTSPRQRLDLELPLLFEHKR